MGVPEGDQLFLTSHTNTGNVGDIMVPVLGTCRAVSLRRIAKAIVGTMIGYRT